MRILMLGNSFTYYHDMPQMLAALLQAEVVSITKGGARLKEHLRKETELQVRTEEALLQSKWDFVILQEQSSAPILEKEDFQPDLITVAYGTNDWRHGTKARFEKECKGFFHNLRNSYPDTKI